MASPLHYYHLLIFSSLFSLIALSESQTAFKPTTLVLPLQKDRATSLHVATIQKRTPLTSLPFLVDVTARFLWADCEKHYLSSTYHAPFCHSTLCARAPAHYCRRCPSPARPGCHNNSCGVLASNPVTHKTATAELAQDVLSIRSARSSNPGPMVTVPQFLFACAPSSLLLGPLPKNVQGIAGFGHGPISLPTQLASHFGFSPQFALCLTASPNSNGVVFFGNGPYYIVPGIDISARAAYTPLTVSRQGEYLIKVSSIKVNGKPIPIKSPSAKQGLIKTMISTTTPYTVLEHSIFTTLTQFFAGQLSGVPQVKPTVSPFGVCFDSTKLPSTRMGPGVPTIDFVLGNRNVTWSIYGANSLVLARPGVACLAFADGGLSPKAEIVIGTYQLEDNLVQFDLGRSRLGFSSSLLMRRTNCANFNFSSTP
ncbi:gamma conglutin 1-like [Actinidia eriantha]|uniref:gamma conglutin 1-like n=1 Tax=Actinidia eriantha TaxID=165200 RepID=UPI00258F8502|nr:gamma conglutin 1-like [Actinidia eriantha]